LKSLLIKKWVLTPHAVERIIERRISLIDLEILINKPDQIINQGPKFILVKKFPGRNDNNIAAVVLEKKGDDLWLVITIMINFQKK